MKKEQEALEMARLDAPDNPKYTAIKLAVKEINTRLASLNAQSAKLQSAIEHDPFVLNTPQWQKLVDQLVETRRELTSLQTALTELRAEIDDDHPAYQNTSHQLDVMASEAFTIQEQLAAHGTIWQLPRQLDAMLVDAASNVRLTRSKRAYGSYLLNQEKMLSLLVDSLHNICVQSSASIPLGIDNFDEVRDADMQFVNSISSFIQLDVVNRSSRESQVIAYTRWIMVADRLMQRGNFQLGTTILHSLNIQGIYRLKLEKGVAPEVLDVRDRYTPMLRGLRNHADLRAAIRDYQEQHGHAVVPFNLTIHDYNALRDRYKNARDNLKELRAELEKLQKYPDDNAKKIAELTPQLKEAQERYDAALAQLQEYCDHYNKSIQALHVELTGPQKQLAQHLDELSTQAKEIEQACVATSMKQLPRGTVPEPFDKPVLAGHPELFRDPQKRRFSFKGALKAITKHPIKAAMGAAATFLLVKAILPIMAFIGLKALFIKLFATSAAAVVSANTHNPEEPTHSTTQQLFDSLDVQPDLVGKGIVADAEEAMRDEVEHGDDLALQHQAVIEEHLVVKPAISCAVEALLTEGDNQSVNSSLASGMRMGVTTV